MKVTYSQSSDAVYIYLDFRATDNPKSTKGIVHRTDGDWPIHLDFTKEGKLFGIEIMAASKTVDISYLKKLDFVLTDKK